MGPEESFRLFSLSERGVTEYPAWAAWESIRRAHEAVRLSTRLIPLATPRRQTYHPHIGLAQHDSCWRIPEASELRAFRDRLQADPCLMDAYVAHKRAIIAEGEEDILILASTVVIDMACHEKRHKI